MTIQNKIPGFQIHTITLVDIDDAEEEYWKCSLPADISELPDIKLPKKIFNGRGVVREIVFSSINELKNLRLDQKVFYKRRNLIEEWKFEYGAVKAKSTNAWKSTMDAAQESEMMPLHVLSGNTIVISKFYDEDKLIFSCEQKIFYE